MAPDPWTSGPLPDALPGRQHEAHDEGRDQGASECQHRDLVNVGLAGLWPTKHAGASRASVPWGFSKTQKNKNGWAVSLWLPF